MRVERWGTANALVMVGMGLVAVSEGFGARLVLRRPCNERCAEGPGKTCRQRAPLPHGPVTANEMPGD
jgi:hypothetical protein